MLSLLSIFFLPGEKFGRQLKKGGGVGGNCPSGIRFLAGAGAIRPL